LSKGPLFWNLIPEAIALTANTFIFTNQIEAVLKLLRLNIDGTGNRDEREMNLFKKTEREGSFGFCHNCPSNKNCCTRMKTNSPIDNAIVFNEEIEQIESYSGVRREDFLQLGRYPADGPYQTLKHNGNSGCYFYKNGRCQIYPVRPLDCRFFPFDIIEDDENDLRWIVYTELCPVDFDYKESFQKLKAFFDLPMELALAYSRGKAPGMESNHYIVLDPVYPDGNKSS